MTYLSVGSGQGVSTGARLSPETPSGAYAPEGPVCIANSTSCGSISDSLARQPGQGSEAETKARDLRAELLQAEAAHFAKKKGVKEEESVAIKPPPPKRLIEGGPGGDEPDDEDPEAKRRRILEETRDIDADSVASDSDSSEEDR